MSQQLSGLAQPMNRRQFVKVAAGTSLGLAAFLAGCGGSSGGSSSLNSNGSASIEFLSVQQATIGWPLILTTLTNQYAKNHPGTTFKVNYVSQPTQLIQQIQLLAGQGALPVLYNTPSNDLMAQLSKDGELLDIGSTFQQLGVADQLVPSAVAIANKIYGSPLAVLPFELNIEGFWYNKQIFAQNGIQPPQTWDQLVQIAASLQQKGIQPDWNLRGVFETDDNGEYWFRSAKPRWYPIPDDGPVGKLLAALDRHPNRAAHVHFIVKARGYDTLITHIFVPDCPFLREDTVFGVRDSLIADFVKVDDANQAATIGLPSPFWSVKWDFVLARAGGPFA